MKFRYAACINGINFMFHFPCFVLKRNRVRRRLSEMCLSAYCEPRAAIEIRMRTKWDNFWCWNVRKVTDSNFRFEDQPGKNGVWMFGLGDYNFQNSRSGLTRSLISPPSPGSPRGYNKNVGSVPTRGKYKRSQWCVMAK